jgi:hypothetical protein
MRVWIDKYREMLFWLLLFGSWQFLASPRDVEATTGAAVTLRGGWVCVDKKTSPLEINDSGG